MPEPGLPSVLAIVVTHNGRRWFKDTLVALNTQTYPALDVLVIDDASLDTREQPHLKRVAKRHLRRRRWGFLRTARPLGFGGAINWALSRVRTDAELLLFLHDDAALDPNAIKRMVARLRADEDTAIVGPKIVSWDDPDRLEEVGMAVDRFGYPYKGLEENEIDLGQHDVASEVFYVTSTCMLVKHDVFKELRGWDSRMRAYAEDLDLCWRARIAGHAVRVEPRARVRHAVALAKGERRSPFHASRYFIRRNRLRTVLKTASGFRLLALIPAFVLLALAEMLAFVVLRQARDVGNVARGLMWNLGNLPQTLSERARVQRLRKVPDRKLAFLTVRQSTRIRSYITHQAGRLEEAWGRRAELVTSRAQQARQVGMRLRGLTGVIAAAAFIVLLLAFRHLLFGPPDAVGELLPYPERATALWRAFLSPWRGSGLGDPSAAPPAFALLGTLQVLTLGAAGAAQKVLVVGLGVVAFIGAYSLVASVTDRISRVVGGLTYAFGAVGYSAVREGALGALVFGAMAPFVLLFMIHLIGWMRPPGWNRGRAVARVAFGSAISAAFVPGSLVLYFMSAILLTATRTFLDRSPKVLRGLMSCMMGLIFGWVLLLPWSATWFGEGGALTTLSGDDTWRSFVGGFADHGMASVLLGQMPETPPLFGIGLVVLGVVALIAGEGQRRRMALALWTLIVMIGWLATALASGSVRPFVASPTELGVLAAAAFAGLAGLAVAAFRLDLPRRGIGLVHALTLGGLAVAAFLTLAGLAPEIMRGAWDPGKGSQRAGSETVHDVADLLALDALERGQFRTLWVGRRWSPPAGSVARPFVGPELTGPRGPVLSDLFAPRAGEPHDRLERVVASVEEGTTDRGGTLLGAFNIAYVVVERGPSAAAWLDQRDLAIVRTESDYYLMTNEDWLPRAGVYEDVPPVARAIEEADTSLIPAELPIGIAQGEQDSASRYVIDDPPAGGTVFLAEASDERWAGNVGREVDGGWGNAWRFEAARDSLVLRFVRPMSGYIWLFGVGLAWIVVLGAAFSRRGRSRAGGPR